MKTKSKKKGPCPVKAGQYYAAAYNGDNGDLIIGRVKSVRRNGEVLLENLLSVSGKTSVKKIEVLLKRNKRVTGLQADAVVKEYKKTGSRAAARQKAVSLAPVSVIEQPATPLKEQLSMKELTERILERVADEQYINAAFWTQHLLGILIRRIAARFRDETHDAENKWSSSPD
jgi:hypothetical protein